MLGAVVGLYLGVGERPREPRPGVKRVEVVELVDEGQNVLRGALEGDRVVLPDNASVYCHWSNPQGVSSSIMCEPTRTVSVPVECVFWAARGMNVPPALQSMKNGTSMICSPVIVVAVTAVAS